MTGPESAVKGEMQTTIESQVGASGIGLFTGEKVSLKILPALPNTGIVFQRVDLPEKPEIPARLAFVREVPRCTSFLEYKCLQRLVTHVRKIWKFRKSQRALRKNET